MKEMTIQEIQTLQLEMMHKVHEFCVSNKIRYSLGATHTELRRHLILSLANFQKTLI